MDILVILIWFVWLAEAAPKQNLRKVCGIYVRYSFFIFISNLVISWLVICYLTLFLISHMLFNSFSFGYFLVGHMLFNSFSCNISYWKNNVVGMYKIIDNDNEKFVGEVYVIF